MRTPRLTACKLSLHTTIMCLSLLCAGTAAPLRLTAAKARVGHAEPAAGAVGIAHAALMLMQRRTSGLTHLCALNPLVRGGAALLLPRQDAAAASAAGIDAEWRAVQCVSSFAFQGTNAHAVLCCAGSDSAACAAAASVHARWRRQRHWYHGPMHQLLQSAGAGAAALEATFQTPLARACLGMRFPS